MKKLKIYLDTSVISFIYADDSPEKQNITREFFEQYISVYDVYISDLVLTEIENTNNAILRNQLKEIVTEYNLQVIEIEIKDRDVVFNLAQEYIKEGVIPPNKLDDAYTHSDLCTLRI